MGASRPLKAPHSAVVVHVVRDDGSIGLGSKVVVKEPEFGEGTLHLVQPRRG